MSRTAYDCAAIRAIVHSWTKCPSADFLAGDMIPGGSASGRARFGMVMARLGARRLTGAILARSSPGTEVFLFCRSVVPDDLARNALDADPETQIVLLGAGLDTSGLRIGAERRAVGQEPGRFFEIDLPDPQAKKRWHVDRVLRKRHSLNDQHISYVACSFGQDDLAAALSAAGFSAAKPTVWVWSGVIHYLTEAAITATLNELSALSAPGSQLFFDFIASEAYERPEEFQFVGTKTRFDAYGEVMAFGLRQGSEHVTAWLAEYGLTFTKMWNAADMVALYEAKTERAAISQGAPWANLCVAALGPPAQRTGM